MAPEQAVDFKRAGKRADIYPLGIILLELLLGDYPSQNADETTTSIALRHSRIGRETIQALVKEANKAMQFAPDDRHNSVDELSTAVARICNVTQ
jgi:serine/threonine protein kinase